jgi:hypothetical protein
MGYRYNSPPNWPEPPSPEWMPPQGWRPDSSWSPAPEGWNFWTWDPSVPTETHPHQEKKAAKARQRQAHADAKARLHKAQANLKSAQKTRDAAVKAAASDVKAAKSQREKEIKTAEEELKSLLDPKGKRLDSYRGVTVYERWIATPDGEGPIADTHTSVDAQISSRITATRLLAIGVFAFAAKKKTGMVFLSIDNPAFASVVECPQDDSAKAHKFAVTVMNAARAATREDATRPQLIEAAEQRKTHALTNTRLDAAQAAQARAEADESLLEPVRVATALVEHARRQLAELTVATVPPGTQSMQS